MMTQNEIHKLFDQLTEILHHPDIREPFGEWSTMDVDQDHVISILSKLKSNDEQLDQFLKYIEANDLKIKAYSDIGFLSGSSGFVSDDGFGYMYQVFRA